MHFLAQTKTSRFFECSKEMAKFYRKEFPDLTIINNEMINYLRNVIKAMKSMMNKELKQFWLSDGTLLDWYRQCGVFSYYTDF